MKREVVQLSARAVAAYRAAGWHISAGGRPHPGLTTGSCTQCGETTVVYGPQGNPLCRECNRGRQ